MRTLLMLICYLCVQPLLAMDRQGIFYYDWPVDDKMPRQVLPQDKSVKNQINATKSMTQLQKLWQESLNRSILMPTVQNITQEKKIAKLYMDVADRYQQRATTVIAHDVELNYILKHPTDHEARRIHDQTIDRQQGLKLERLAKTHGLFFFYAGNCNHSRLFASTIKQFALKYGFEIIPITIDGNMLAEFPNSRLDQGQAKNLKITSVPAVFAINPSNNTAPILVGFGNISVNELASNLERHLEYSLGDGHDKK